MNEGGGLIQNMSAPPKTTVRYSGLANMVGNKNPSSSKANSKGKFDYSVFGQPVCFRLPRAARTGDPKKLMALLAPGISSKSPKQDLLRLIEERAKKLSWPDGTLVMPADKDHEPIWDDILVALVVLTKSSKAIWLRTKSPRLSVIPERFQASLLLPPSCLAGSRGIAL